jgi:glycosyltransferase involved in cell wall biosynthesis
MQRNINENNYINLPGIIIPAYNPDEKLLVLIKKIIIHPFLFIVIVDDGSDKKTKHLFNYLKKSNVITILHHEKNMGKGAALKTAFNYISEKYKNFPPVVTADADGQHDHEDIVRIAMEIVSDKNAFFIGKRDFRSKIPHKSKLGNALCRFILKLITGVKLIDTQSGLRGIPGPLIPKFINLKSSKYDFEMEMILTTISSKIKIKEIKINTIYYNNNASSNFKPLVDSFNISLVLFRYFWS